MWIPTGSPTLLIQDGGDEPHECLKQPGVTMPMHSKKRMGYSRIMNVALGAAFEQGYDVALVWNSDARFANDSMPPDVLLPYFANDPRIGAVGPSKEIQGPDKWADAAGGPKDDKDRVCGHVILTEYGPAFDSLERGLIQRVTGMGYCPLFAVRLEAFIAVGGFDTSFTPGFFEDADLWRKLRLAGYETIAVSSVTYFHGDDKGASQTFRKLFSHREMVDLSGRNLEWLLSKWGITEPCRDPLLPSPLDPRVMAREAALEEAAAASTTSTPPPTPGQGTDVA